MMTKTELEAKLKGLEQNINSYVNPFALSFCKSYMQGQCDMIKEILYSSDV